MSETIFALSSGAPPAAIGILRLSGDDAFDIAARLCPRSALPPMREARVRALCSDQGEVLDQALILCFPAQSSVTGEPLVEIHCHGGRAVITAIEARLAELGGRRAVAGEFTRRAFINHRMDLAQVEGLSDLLAAETEGQRRSAIAMVDGHFSRRITAFERQLLHVSARVEALLDFSDEDDVATRQDDPGIREGLRALTDVIAAERARPHARALKDGIRVVFCGPPNAGKSSLINALVERDVSIVSARPGTTRDQIDVPISLGGIAFVLSDTAGLRAETEDEIEAIGIARAQKALVEADIVCWLGNPEDCPPSAIHVITKADVGSEPYPSSGVGSIVTSAVTGQGLGTLVDVLLRRAQEIVPRDGGYALSERQHALLDKAGEFLAEAQQTSDLLIVAESLRLVRMQCDQLTGRAGTEALLDQVFSGFCIGK